MLNRLGRFVLVGAFATAIAGYGTAYAQPDDDDEMEMGDEDVGDDSMDDAMDEGTGEGDATPAEGEGEGEETAAAEDEGGDAAATGQKAGAIKAGALVLLPSGMGDDLEIGFGKYLELRPWATYAVNEKITAGAVIPLLLLTPDFGDNGPELLQGIMAWGDYAVNDKISAGAMVGMARPGRMGINPFGGIVSPGAAGDLKAGFGVGADYSHVAGKIKAGAGAAVVLQMDSDTNDDGELTMGMFLHVPIHVMYAVNEKLDAGVKTGIYSAPGFSFDTDEGMTVPLMLAGKYAVSDQIKAGLMAGFSSVVAPEGVDLMDTLSVGLFAAWQK